MNLLQDVQATVAAIRAAAPTTAPAIGVILGTGLGGLLSEAAGQTAVSYESLPHMPRSTAPTHQGRLVFGTLAGKPVVILDGRFHLYEGYAARQVAYPVWVLKQLGVRTLLVSNVAGGLNPEFAIGDLMVIADHLNLQGTSPLIGDNPEELGPRFPDMIEPYDRRLADLAEQVGRASALPMRRGVYAAMVGPQLETRAEYRMLQRLGADAIGMSTVPEVIAAAHAGLQVLGVSLISDLCLPESLKPVNIEDIIAVAKRAEPLLTKLFLGVIAKL